MIEDDQVRKCIKYQVSHQQMFSHSWITSWFENQLPEDSSYEQTA